MSRFARAFSTVCIASLVLFFAASPTGAMQASVLVIRLVSAASSIDVNSKDEEAFSWMREFFDLDAMAMRPLGDKARFVIGSLRERYLSSYRRLLIRFLQNRFGVIRPERLRVLGTRQLDEHTELVTTRIRIADGSEHDVDWFARTQPAPRIIDIAYDGTLISDAQRREFASIIRRNAGDLTALPEAIDRLYR